MVFQAELNNENICIGIKLVKELINDGNHIEIDEMDNDYLWKKYENQKWSTEKYFPEFQEAEPTLEEMQMQTLLNSEYLVIMSELTNL